MTATLPRPGNVCETRDGRFVDPCVRLLRAPFLFVQILDHRTRAPSRSFVAVEDDAGAMTAFMTCPFCGVSHGGRS